MHDLAQHACAVVRGLLLSSVQVVRGLGEVIAGMENQTGMDWPRIGIEGEQKQRQKGRGIDQFSAGNPDAPPASN